MAEYEYAISEGGYIRCCNCEAIKGDPHAEGCTGGSLLVTIAPRTPAPPKRDLPTALAELDKVLAIQKADGNWNYDSYMFGLANGLIMARSCLTGEDPEFLKAPEEWLADRPDNGEAPTEAAP